MQELPLWVWLGPVLGPPLGVAAAAVMARPLTWRRGLVSAAIAQIVVSVAALYWGGALLPPAVGSTSGSLPSAPAERALFVAAQVAWTLAYSGALTAVARRALGGRSSRGAVLYERAGPAVVDTVGAAVATHRADRVDAADAAGAAPSSAPPVAGTTEAGPYAAAWADYRQRWRLFVLTLLALPIAVLATPFVGSIGVVAVFVAGAYASNRCTRWLCPRCGKPFFSHTPMWAWRQRAHPFARRCLHCGLPKWAEGDFAEWSPATAFASRPVFAPPPIAHDSLSLGTVLFADGLPSPIVAGTPRPLAEGETVVVARLPARKANEPAPAGHGPRVGEAGVVVQIRPHPEGGATYVVMSLDPTTRDAWWAEFTEGELLPALPTPGAGQEPQA
jgi:hypothetical protein